MKVLLATDGDEPSRHAVELLSALARRGTQVHVLSVNSFELAMHIAEGSGHYSPDAGRDRAQRAVDDGVEVLRAAGMSAVTGEVRQGDEGTEIVATAGDVDMVVVGSGKQRWVDAVVLGSVASSVVHASPSPVLVVHESPEANRRVRAVIGADGSEGSRHAIDAFASLADPARCEITVAAVAAASDLPGAQDEATDDDATHDAGMAAATQHADEASLTLRKAGFLETWRWVESGVPAPKLLECADQVGADLVVVGARGLGRFEAKVLGSVSDRLMRKARATLIGR
jgi:nucleotide-binding universal stress UspA family protein